MTGGGAHVTVLLEEAVEALAIKADGVYVDATFGRGGHSRRILSCLNEQGRLVALCSSPVGTGRRVQTVGAGVGANGAVRTTASVGVDEGPRTTSDTSLPGSVSSPRRGCCTT